MSRFFAGGSSSEEENESDIESGQEDLGEQNTQARAPARFMKVHSCYSIILMYMSSICNS